MNELSELIKAVESFEMPPAVDIEYRLYYNDAGRVLTMSSSDYPSGDNYILISRDVYDRADYSLRVVNGEIVDTIDPNKHYCDIVPGERFRVVKGHASIIVDETYQGETETYGFKNH